MGEQLVRRLNRKKERTFYIGQLLHDLEALDRMLREGLIERQPIRIGAEQEFCLVDNNWYPADNALEVLEGINDPHFTTEIARYNLELNMDPSPLEGRCFSEMHQTLRKFLQKAEREAKKRGTHILLTGILPTISYKHLKLDYMCPRQRYYVLNDAIKALRKSEFNLHIKGVDEVNLLHDSILFEGCNTSFQAHLQIDPEDFVDSYNWAQAIAGPILASAVNSPLLLGKELWSETRIALFTQSVDTRKSSYQLNQREARVSFGSSWARGTAVDIFRDNVVRFRSLVTSDLGRDSLEELADGNIPKLRALALHNGTVYRWNRPCYGVGNGKPHLRIENRYIPSGPSTSDEIANFMFWVGVMRGRPKKYDRIDQKIHFKDVKANFFNAARYGMATQFYWDGKLIPSDRLILDELLPMAYRGLYSMNVAPEDAEHYLSIVEQRVQGQTGARWMVNSFRNLRKRLKTSDALRALTVTIHHNQEKGYPASVWPVMFHHPEVEIEKDKYVFQRMTREVFSVHEKDSAALVVKMMEWKHINHVPVVNGNNDLTGLLTSTDVSKLTIDEHHQSVKSIVIKGVITIDAYAMVEEARRSMETHGIHCLPVTYEGRLVGILTDKDI